MVRTPTSFVDVLEMALKTPTNNTASRSDAERHAGRKLVAFYRKQVGRTMKVTYCSVASPRDVEQGGTVISCITPPGSDSHYITSVDCVRLMSYLLNPQDQKLSIDEKNRIRRTLEPFRPMTVKRTDARTASIFNWVISMPEPRPVTISKDIKLFDWDTLEPGIAKILAKYVRGIFLLCPILSF